MPNNAHRDLETRGCCTFLGPNGTWDATGFSYHIRSSCPIYPWECQLHWLTLCHFLEMALRTGPVLLSQGAIHSLCLVDLKCQLFISIWNNSVVPLASQFPVRLAKGSPKALLQDRSAFFSAQSNLPCLPLNLLPTTL